MNCSRCHKEITGYMVNKAGDDAQYCFFCGKELQEDLWLHGIATSLDRIAAALESKQTTTRIVSETPKVIDRWRPWKSLDKQVTCSVSDCETCSMLQEAEAERDQLRADFEQAAFNAKNNGELLTQAILEKNQLRAELAEAKAELERLKDHPIIVCLCGSTRVKGLFHKANLSETLAGKIVLSIGCDFRSDDAIGLVKADKVRLDELHLRKIDMSDEVFILNANGYIGESTSRELAYAKEHGKTIRFLEEPLHAD